MANPTSIIISSRRNTTREIALRLNESLSKLIPNATIHNGVEKISHPGMTLLDAIPHVAAQCDALLVIIGSDWMSDTAWINNAKDFNRMAMVAALNGKRKVIPVLIDGAQMPSSGTFSGDLAAFGGLKALKLNAMSFDQDVAQIVQFVSGAGTQPAAQQVSRPAASPQPAPTPSRPPAPTPSPAPAAMVVSPPREVHVTTPHAAQPAPVAMAMPSAPNKAQQISQTLDIVVGQTTMQGTTLYTLPHEKSLVRTQVPPATVIAVLARDNKNDWLNVVHISTTQQQIVGWVPASMVEHLSFQGRSVMMLDLNISQFEQHTHDDIVEFIRLEKQRLTVPGLLAGMGSLGGFGAMLAAASMDDGMAGLAFIVGLALLIGSWVVYAVKTSETNTNIKKLEQIRKSKRSTGQVAAEAAAAATKKAVGTAVGLAALLGTAAVVANASKNSSSTKKKP